MTLLGRALGALAGRIRSLAPVTVLLLAVPLTWSVRDARELTKTDARVVAHHWIDANLPKRPVYVIRVDQTEIDALASRYDLQYLDGPTAAGLTRVLGRRAGS